MSIPKDIKEKSKLSKDEWREYTKTVWHIANTTHADHPAVFPLEIPHRLIKLFSWHGELVLDPFAGMGTTGEAAVILGRRVVCVDQNPEYTDFIRHSSRDWAGGRGTTGRSVQVVHGDSRDLSFMGDGSVSLIVSSPPYWNKASYGPSEANLGRVPGIVGFWRRFARSLRNVIACWHLGENAV